MLNITQLSETKLKEILTTFETPGYRFLLEVLQEKTDAALSKMLTAEPDDIKNLSYWRGLEEVRRTLTELPQIIAGRSKDIIETREQNIDPAWLLGEVTDYVSNPPYPVRPSPQGYPNWDINGTRYAPIAGQASIPWPQNWG